MSIEVRNSKYILSDACGWSWSWRWSGGGGGGGFGTWSILGTSALWRLQEVKLQKVQLIHSLGQDRGLITTWDFDGLFFVKIAVYQVSDEGYILPPKRSEKGVMPPKHQQRSKARLSQNQRILCIYIYNLTLINSECQKFTWDTHHILQLLQFKVLQHDLHVSLWYCPSWGTSHTPFFQIQ